MKITGFISARVIATRTATIFIALFLVSYSLIHLTSRDPSSPSLQLVQLKDLDTQDLSSKQLRLSARSIQARKSERAKRYVEDTLFAGGGVKNSDKLYGPDSAVGDNRDPGQSEDEFDEIKLKEEQAENTEVDEEDFDNDEENDGEFLEEGEEGEEEGEEGEEEEGKVQDFLEAVREGLQAEPERRSEIEAQIRLLTSLKQKLMLKLKVNQTAIAAPPSQHAQPLPYKPYKKSQYQGKVQDIHTNGLKSYNADGKSCNEDIQKPSEDMITYINGWQELVYSSAHALYLFRAYYDDRLNLRYTPLVRLYAVVSAITMRTDVHCYLWYHTAPYLHITSLQSKYNLSAGKKIFFIYRPYTQYLLSCPLPDGRQPSHVSLAVSSCEQPHTLVTILYAEPTEPTNQHQFAVCTVPQYGNMADNHVAFFVEWVELNKLFGVSEITIYNSTLSTSPLAQQALDYYISSGLLRIEQHKGPVTNYPAIKEYDVSQLGLRSSVNDCLLRNMYRYTHLILIDRDEVIVPHSYKDYAQLLSAEVAKQPVLADTPAISVRNAFFYLDYARDETVQSELVSIQYRTHKMPDDPFNVNFIPAKSFINPQRCMAAWNHHCLLPWKGKRFIDSQAALVHHYRSSCEGAGTAKDSFKLAHTRCRHLLNNTQTDDVMLQFSPTLEARVKQVLQEIIK